MGRPKGVGKRDSRVVFHGCATRVELKIGAKYTVPTGRTGNRVVDGKEEEQGTKIAFNCS